LFTELREKEAGENYCSWWLRRFYGLLQFWSTCKRP